MRGDGCCADDSWAVAGAHQEFVESVRHDLDLNQDWHHLLRGAGLGNDSAAAQAPQLLHRAAQRRERPVRHTSAGGDERGHDWQEQQHGADLAVVEMTRSHVEKLCNSA